MPFTPTHILAIVPIAACSRWLPFSALAVGCMIPDLPLFVPGCDYATTHSATGVLTVCVPLGLVTFVLFQSVVKVPMVALMPAWVQQRCVDDSSNLLKPSYLFFLGVCVAIAFGAYTHIVWDAFTHQGRWGTTLFPSLNEKITFAGVEVSGFKLFQYGSTIVGIPLMLILWAWRLSQTSPQVAPTEVCLSQSLKITVSCIIVGVPMGIAAGRLVLGNSTLYQRLGLAITTAGSAFVLLAVAYSLLFQWRFAQQLDVREV